MLNEILDNEAMEDPLKDPNDQRILMTSFFKPVKVVSHLLDQLK